MSAEEKRWRLVCYDIRDPKRYRKAYKVIRGNGVTLQYSIFRCYLDAKQVERLRFDLAKIMNREEDRLFILDLCPTCAENATARNDVTNWVAKPATHRVV